MFVWFWRGWGWIYTWLGVGRLNSRLLRDCTCVCMYIWGVGWDWVYDFESASERVQRCGAWLAGPIMHLFHESRGRVVYIYILSILYILQVCLFHVILSCPSSVSMYISMYVYLRVYVYTPSHPSFSGSVRNRWKRIAGRGSRVACVERPRQMCTVYAWEVSLITWLGEDGVVYPALGLGVCMCVCMWNLGFWL